MNGQGSNPEEQQLDATAASQMLFQVLAPELVEEAEKLKNGEFQLVHYTSAENARNIIRNKEFWLRNVRCMNDFSEVQHGIQLILRVFRDNDHARLKRLYETLDKIHPGAAKAGVDKFDSWINIIPDNTFIGCLSLFDPKDSFGRLSMWRAYSSKSSGIALVMNVDPFIAETNELGAYSLPVAYLSDEDFAAGIDRCLDTLEGVLPVVSAMSAEMLENSIFWWLLCLSVGLKHPGFHEEREWRIIRIPQMYKSNVVKEEVECIGGIPQIVQKIPLLDDPDNGLVKADIPNLLKKVIIGPTEYPLVLQEAMASLLSQAGVDDPYSRIDISFIPLR